MTADVEEVTMYCSGCGWALAQGQQVCQQCGRPAAVPVPPVPGMALLVDSYANRVKTLGVFWLVYAGLSLLLGFMGLAFAHVILNHHLGGWDNGPWNHGPFGPDFFGPVLLRFAGVMLVGRAALAVVAGWGLLERRPWGRLVAIVAAIVSLLKFPFGTALGIWTLVTLMGYRNTTLYDQL
jgi:hypothetical protein